MTPERKQELLEKALGLKTLTEEIIDLMDVLEIEPYESPNIQGEGEQL